MVGGSHIAAQPDAVQYLHVHFFRAGLDQIAPPGIGLGGIQIPGQGNRRGKLRYLHRRYRGPGLLQSGHSLCKSCGRFRPDIVKHHRPRHRKPHSHQRRPGQIGRPPASQHRQPKGGIGDRPAQRPHRIERPDQRHHALQGQKPMCGLEPHQIIPRRRHPDRPAGIGPYRNRGQVERHRRRSAG